MIENELKYILNLGAATDALWGNGKNVTRIQQGYLGNEGARIRKEDDWRNSFTYKIDTPDGVEEFEIVIDDNSYARCWDIAHHKLIKDRVFFEHEGDDWVIDRFLRPDLSVYFCMAEVEMIEGKEKPDNIPESILKYLVYTVPRNEGARWSSKAISNVSDAMDALETFLVE